MQVVLYCCADLCSALQNGKNKLEIDVPPVLDEGAIDLEEKNNWWPFAEPGGGPLQRGSG